MDLFDFFFPEQAQAKHLRQIARSQTIAAASTRSDRQSEEVAALRTDVKFLTLVLTTILKRLAENKTMSLADVQDLLGEIDALDGMPDGGLDPNVLRGLLGVVKRIDEDHPDSATFRIDADPLERYRR
jgi:hypothetical protein